MIVLLLEHVRLVSLANVREHWAPRAKRAQMQRGIARIAVQPKVQGQDLSGPLTVIITRLAPRSLDSDNAVGSAKNLRDGIADALGVNDNDPRVTWVVEQEKSKGYGVRIQIVRAA